MKPCRIESVNKRKIPFFALMVCWLFLCFVTGWPLLAFAAPKHDPLGMLKTIQLQYQVYLGGMHVMDSTTTFVRTGPRYEINMKAGTQGFLRSFAEWDADLSSKGKLEMERVKPTQGVVVTKWQNEPKTVRFIFNKKKHVDVQFDPPENSNKHEPVPDSLKADALDPLSSIVQMMASFTYGKGCDQTVPVYDGHRRFDLTLQDRGVEYLEGEDYSIFTGEAQRCEADFTMRAGTRKDREGSRFWEDAAGKKTRPPVYVYLAQLKPDLPAVPVRAETSTVFGTIMVHLKDYSAVKLQAQFKP